MDKHCALYKNITKNVSLVLDAKDTKKYLKNKALMRIVYSTPTPPQTLCVDNCLYDFNRNKTRLLTTNWPKQMGMVPQFIVMR